MEFEDMKKIWDSQNNEPLYAINETALYKPKANVLVHLFGGCCCLQDYLF